MWWVMSAMDQLTYCLHGQLYCLTSASDENPKPTTRVVVGNLGFESVVAVGCIPAGGGSSSIRLWTPAPLAKLRISSREQQEEDARSRAERHQLLYVERPNEPFAVGICHR